MLGKVLLIKYLVGMYGRLASPIHPLTLVMNMMKLSLMKVFEVRLPILRHAPIVLE